MPKSRIEFWKDKFAQNKKRDAYVKKELLSQGIRVLVVWECSIKDALKNYDIELLLEQIEAFLSDDEKYSEI